MYEFFRKIVCLSMHIKYRIKVIGGDNRPYKNGIKGGYIIACNHQDYGDPPLIAAVNKAHFSFMAKIELFEKNKFFAWLITKCGAFPVVRGAGDGSAIDHAIADLEKNRAFVIFPEGTRSKDGNIGRAKSGIAVIAGKKVREKGLPQKSMDLGRRDDSCGAYRTEQRRQNRAKTCFKSYYG